MTAVSLRLSLLSANRERGRWRLCFVWHVLGSLKRSRYLILFVSYIVVHKKTFILVMFRVLGLSVENIAI